MAALRSPRLERLLGARVADVTYEQVCALVGARAAEAYDLDFKSELYGRSDSDKRDLCGDVAAMANTAGGLIILGIEEDDQAQASGYPGVTVSDDEVRRILSIVASGISPLPAFDVRPVTGPSEGTGFILISVSRSAAGPHAVLVNQGLRFPRRNGSITTYLSEPEVAAAYRSRFTGLQDRATQLELCEEELLQNLETDTQTFVVVSLLPDIDGSLAVDTQALRVFREEIQDKTPLIVNTGAAWLRTSVGPDRLIADGTSSGDKAKWLGCELHARGAGSFAATLACWDTGGSPERPYTSIDDEHLVNGVVSGLRFLARHARDRAATSGNASVRATIRPVSDERPARLTHTRWHGMPQVQGKRTLRTPPMATTVIDIDETADDGPPVLAAAYRLTNGFFQAFGAPEVLQITDQGALRRRYWSADWRNPLQRWAEQAEVVFTDETLSE